jgi:hypothetical protein
LSLTYVIRKTKEKLEIAGNSLGSFLWENRVAKPDHKVRICSGDIATRTHETPKVVGVGYEYGFSCANQ